MTTLAAHATSDAASVIRWRDLPQDHPMALIDRRRVIGSHLMISEVHLHRGFRVPTHHHANEQFAWVLSGRVRFGIGADDSSERREVILSAGEMLHLPPGVPHSAEALEDSMVVDLFSPPSEKTGVDAHGRCPFTSCDSITPPVRCSPSDACT